MYDENWKIRDSDVVFFVNHFIKKTTEEKDKDDQLIVAHLECIMTAMKIGNACHLYVSPAKLIHMDRIYETYRTIGSRAIGAITRNFHSLEDTVYEH